MAPRFTRTSLDSAWILDTLDTISYELVFGIVFGIFRSAQKYDMDSTAWNVCVFGVILIRIFPHSDWITPDTGTFSGSVLGTLDTIIMNLYIAFDICKKYFKIWYGDKWAHLISMEVENIWI